MVMSQGIQESTKYNLFETAQILLGPFLNVLTNNTVVFNVQAVFYF